MYQSFRLSWNWIHVIKIKLSCNLTMADALTGKAESCLLVNSMNVNKHKGGIKTQAENIYQKKKNPSEAASVHLIQMKVYLLLCIAQYIPRALNQ